MNFGGDDDVGDSIQRGSCVKIHQVSRKLSGIILVQYIILLGICWSE